MNPSSLFSSLKAISIFVFILLGSASSQCPFDFLFHFGDGVFDNGNAIRMLPFGPLLPATRPPYGMTWPGTPTGRWCDGQLDIDVGAAGMGFPHIEPYLSGNASNYSGIIFAVARSPVLDRSFFVRRGVKIPSTTASLEIQLSWFKSYIKSICTTPEDCRDKVANSLILFGDVEANDITIPLLRGKTLEEVATYVPYVNEAQLKAAREVIKMGATRLILPGNNPIGCYPHILTVLHSNNPEDYDELGCLKKVNELIKLKNQGLQQVVNQLQEEFPDMRTMFYSDFYSAFKTILNESLSGSNGSVAMKACCGIGGKYNYDPKRFCGDAGVPVCSNPNEYIFWDGIHLTENTNRRLSLSLQGGAAEALNCTVNTLSSPTLDEQLSSSI